MYEITMLLGGNDNKIIWAKNFVWIYTIIFFIIAKDIWGIYKIIRNKDHTAVI